VDDLIMFWAARLDEIEMAAKAAQAPSPWKAAVHESDTWIVTDAAGEPLIFDEGTPSLEEAAHIALHDPGRVLRKVEADREILTAYIKAEADGIRGDGWIALRFAVETLTGAYRDHPDYRPEWLP
jgi:hypothetical protein